VNINEHAKNLKLSGVLPKTAKFLAGKMTLRQDFLRYFNYFLYLSSTNTTYSHNNSNYNQLLTK